MNCELPNIGFLSQNFRVASTVGDWGQRPPPHGKHVGMFTHLFCGWFCGPSYIFCPTLNWSTYLRRSNDLNLCSQKPQPGMADPNKPPMNQPGVTRNRRPSTIIIRIIHHDRLLRMNKKSCENSYCEYEPTANIISAS